MDILFDYTSVEELQKLINFRSRQNQYPLSDEYSCEGQEGMGGEGDVTNNVGESRKKYRSVGGVFSGRCISRNVDKVEKVSWIIARPQCVSVRDKLLLNQSSRSTGSEINPGR